MTTPWRDDPLLAGRFHPDYPDDIQVLVHDGEQRRTNRIPEACWVRIEAVHSVLRSPLVPADAELPVASTSPAIRWVERTVYRGRVLNVPTQLTTVEEGSEILFLHVPGPPHPLMVTEGYLQERPQWAFHPCDKCGSDQGLDPPTVMARTRFPTAPEGSTPVGFTAFCSCGGIMTVGVIEDSDETEPPPKKPWWRFW